MFFFWHWCYYMHMTHYLLYPSFSWHEWLKNYSSLARKGVLINVCYVFFWPNVEGGASSHKIDYVRKCYEVQNSKGHQKCKIGIFTKKLIKRLFLLVVLFAHAKKEYFLQYARYARYIFGQIKENDCSAYIFGEFL